MIVLQDYIWKKSGEYNAIVVSFLEEIENLNAFQLRKMEEPLHFISDSSMYLVFYVLTFLLADF